MLFIAELLITVATIILDITLQQYAWNQKQALKDTTC